MPIMRERGICQCMRDCTPGGITGLLVNGRLHGFVYATSRTEKQFIFFLFGCFCKTILCSYTVFVLWDAEKTHNYTICCLKRSNRFFRVWLEQSRGSKRKCNQALIREQSTNLCWFCHTHASLNRTQGFGFPRSEDSKALATHTGLFSEFSPKEPYIPMYLLSESHRRA